MFDLRSVIVKKFQNGAKCGAIFRDLKHLGVKRGFVYYTIKRFVDTGSIENRPKPGRKRCVRTPRVIKVVRERIRRGCDRSARKMAAELNISRESVRRILRKDLDMKAFKKRKIHGLTEATKQKRKQRSKLLLSWHADSEIFFSDEKLFVLQAPHHTQNDRLWGVSISDIPKHKRNVPRYQNSSSVMVWGAISRKGKLPLVFIDKGVKINAKYYLEEVLQKRLIPAVQQMYGTEYYCFQQDGAPAHTANLVQKWCEENLTDYIPKNEWPPSSPDLNPLDFCIWGYMLQKLKKYKYHNLDDFKAVIIKLWDDIPMDVVRAACDVFAKRLKLVIRANGGTIE